MTKICTIEAKPYHCGQMIRRLRSEHRAAIAATGIDAHRELRSRFEASGYRRACFADGELIAIGGVVGSLMSPAGYIWLAISEKARRFPVALIKELNKQLDEIMVLKRELATVILPSDNAAMRLAVFMGFHVSDDGLGSPAGTRMERKALLRYLDAANEIRIPMGTAMVIPVGYHREAI